MKIDRDLIMDDLEDIQDNVDSLGFIGSNENDLWRREQMADYIVKKLTLTDVVGHTIAYELLAYTKFLRDELHLNISDTWIESYVKNSK